MNALILKKETDRLERSIQRANRTLLEFKVARAKWEIKNGMGKVYTSIGALMRDVKRSV